MAALQIRAIPPGIAVPCTDPKRIVSVCSIKSQTPRLSVFALEKAV